MFFVTNPRVRPGTAGAPTPSYYRMRGIAKIKISYRPFCHIRLSARRYYRAQGVARECILGEREIEG